MKIKKMMTYNTPEGVMVETVTWMQVGAGNPNGVALEGETGLWKFVSASNPSRDLQATLVQTGTEEYVSQDTKGQPAIMKMPVMMPGSSTWDYYALPLKAGWTVA